MLPRVDGQGYPDPANYDFEPLTGAEKHLDTLATNNHPYFWFLHNFNAGKNPFFKFFFGQFPLNSLQNFQAERSLRMSKSDDASELNFFYTTQGGQEGEKLNEDAICIYPIGPNRILAAVYDGASSQKPITGLESFKVSGAFYVSHLAALGFPTTEDYEKLTQNQDLTAKEIMIALNRWLYQELVKVQGVDYSDVLTIPGMAATIALIDFNKMKVSIAHVADTIGIATHEVDYVILTDNKNQPFDEATLTLVQQIASERNISIREAAKDPRVKIQLADSFRQKINSAGGCGVLNGMPELVLNNLIYTLSVPIDPLLQGLHLMSDGFYTPWLGQQDGNPDLGMKKVLGAIERRCPYYPPIESATDPLDYDPDFMKIPRLKRRDDITLLSIRFPLFQASEKSRLETVKRQALLAGRVEDQ